MVSGAGARRKGMNAEREAAAIIHDLCGWNVRRIESPGSQHDTGDLFGVPDTVVQVVAWADTLAAVRTKPLEAETQRERAQVSYVATFVKLPRAGWRVVLTPEQWATLARSATADNTQDR
jgi:Holliday junction resolvase